jgi:cysteine synthase A
MILYSLPRQKGLLKKGYTIVEASTGNTGTALAMVGTVKGYKVIIYIPRGLSEERYKMMRAFGAEVRFVEKNNTFHALQKARTLGKKKGVYHPDQFSNPWNVEEHEKHMGKEILEQLKVMKVKTIDAVVAGIGSGGTIIGLGKALKKRFPNIKVFGVEPVECALTYEHMHNQKEVCRPHKIEGIADGFIPPIVEKNKEILDKVIKINSEDAIKESEYLAKKHGFFVGISSGANFLAAKKIKKKYNNVVTVFADEGEKYLSRFRFS